MANLSNINNKFLVTTGGNVLIGQTAVVGTSVLQAEGGTNAIIRMNSTSGTGGRMDFAHGGSNYGNVGSARNMLGVGNATDMMVNGDSILYLGVGAQHMTILPSGNVGIGTTNPLYDLQIGDNGVAGSYSMMIEGQFASVALASNPRLNLIDTNFGITAGKYGSGASDDAIGIFAFQGAGRGILFAHTTAGSGTTLQDMRHDMFIDGGTGNVGIGDTNPVSYKLAVSGTVKGDSFSVDAAPSRIFAPAGATYNGSGTQTGYLIAKLPDNGASGLNNMMTGVIRVFDYSFHESFDVHFAGYWYAGYNWTNCTAWIDSSSYDDRNFTVRFGAMTGAAGAGTRPYIIIADPTSTWTYCKFSVINYEPGHSNYQAYKWDSGWNMDISATNPGVVARTISNCQVNNWARNGQDLYYGSGTGNVGIGTTSPDALLELSKSVVNAQGATLRLTNAIGGSGAGVAIEFNGPGGQPIHAKIKTEDLGAYDSKLIFQTKVSGTSGALSTRMSIDNNGQVYINGGCRVGGLYITALQGNAQLTNASTSSGSNASYIGQGLISVSISDAKAKENFSDVQTNECLNKIVSLADHVKKFDWIDEDWKKQKGRTVGMVAQEIYEDHSEFVHKPENYDDDGWAIRYQEIVPTLIKAIQELKAEIELLKSK